MRFDHHQQSAELARTITKRGSLQTYYTARLMVDKDLVDDFLRAYAYFRWIDDVIDIEARSDQERLAFIEEQSQLIDNLYRGLPPGDLVPEEQILSDLVQNDREENSGLQSFIRNMFAIIAFDARRKGRLIRSEELEWYVNTLGKSVTDGLLYFVGNGSQYPQSGPRYQAGIAAHISHLLRDTHQDNRDGFFNIPAETLTEHGISWQDVDSQPYREWVRGRVGVARVLFKQGKGYLDSLGVLRTKIVGYWYCARFEVVLDTIEADDYRVREDYHERRQVRTWLKILWLGIALSFKHLAARRKYAASLTNQS